MWVRTCVPQQSAFGLEPLQAAVCLFHRFAGNLGMSYFIKVCSLQSTLKYFGLYCAQHVRPDYGPQLVVRWQEATLVKGGLRYHHLDILCIWRRVCSMLDQDLYPMWVRSADSLPLSPKQTLWSAGFSFGDHRKNLKMEGGFFFL